MYFYTALASALLAVPSLVAASGSLGFSLGSINPDGSNKAVSDYESDFDKIKSNTGSNIVRIYAASQADTAANILPAAKSKGFQVILGVWVIDGNTTDASFDADTAAIANVADQYKAQIYAVTVGSEGLYRGNYTATQLLAKIQKFKSAVPSVQKVGTADTWNMYTQGQADALITSGQVNILLANAFAYWQNGGDPINNATYTYYDDIAQTLGYIQRLSNSLTAIEFWTGETGWPTDGGSNYGQAKAGTTNAEQFWNTAVCSMLHWGGNVFYFEAFDEPQKPPSIGEDGQAAIETKWGAMNADGSLKFDLSCKASSSSSN